MWHTENERGKQQDRQQTAHIYNIDGVAHLCVMHNFPYNIESLQYKSCASHLVLQFSCNAFQYTNK